MPEPHWKPALEKHYDGVPRGSYEPVRSCFCDLFNASTPLFDGLPETPFPYIEKKIRSKTSSPARIASNISVAKAIHDYVTAKSITSRQFEFGKLVLPFNVGMRYWINFVAIVNKRPTVMFIDPRRTNGLNRQGRQFAFSVMHEFIREQNPDFSDAQLAIMKFTFKKDGNRAARIYIEQEKKLLSYSEILSNTQEIYRIWDQVIAEKQRAPKKKSGGSGGFI